MNLRKFWKVFVQLAIVVTLMALASSAQKTDTMVTSNCRPQEERIQRTDSFLREHNNDLLECIRRLKNSDEFRAYQQYEKRNRIDRRTIDEQINARTDVILDLVGN